MLVSHLANRSTGSAEPLESLSWWVREARVDARLLFAGGCLGSVLRPERGYDRL
jgi:hypothetical protein